MKTYDISKLHYFWNGQVYVGFDANYTRQTGYWYTVGQVRRSAIAHGFTGIKKVDYFFAEESLRREERSHAESKRDY